MPPSERDPFAPDPLISPPSESAPLAPPPEEISLPPEPTAHETVFETALAPVALLPPSGPPIYRPSLDPPPIASPFVDTFAPTPALPPAPETTRRIPRWRWAFFLLLIGFYPVWMSLLGEFLSLRFRGKSKSALPSSPIHLVISVSLDLAIFGVIWWLGWLFSRATKDELLLRWRGGFWKPITQGFGYALGIRLAIVVAFMFVFLLASIALAVAGHDPKALGHLIEHAAPKDDALFPKGALSNPLYLLLTVTLLSFVAAGGREELWRTACLAALRHLLPDRMSERARWGWAIGLSSVIFGLGHVYQGGLGVIITGIIGAGLGVLTWRNRSIWPSVWAHGFFDATSFLLAAVAMSKKLPIPLWLGF